jgi:hypothetical protein
METAVFLQRLAHTRHDVSQKLKIGLVREKKVENGSGGRVGSAARGRDWLAPDLTSALLHIEQGEGLALGCKVTPRGSGYSSTQDNRANLRPVLGRLVRLVVLAVMLDVVVRRSRMRLHVPARKLIRCVYIQPHSRSLDVTCTQVAVCARGLVFLVKVRDGSLLSPRTASIGTTEFESWLSSEGEMLEPVWFAVSPCSGFPKIPVRTASNRRLGLWRDQDVLAAVTWACCMVEDNRCVCLYMLDTLVYFHRSFNHCWSRALLR